jgi:hypothetical protein
MTLDPALELVLRGALALLLVAGAIGKARDRASFRAAVEGYELLPARAAGVAALVFTALEAALGSALLLPAAFGLRDAAAAGAALLFALYAAAIAVNLARGRREIDCGCGGAAAHLPLSGWLVARNGVLVALALACRAEVSPRALGAVDAPTIAGGVALLALVWVAAHGLLAHEAALARFQEDV